MLEVDQPDRMGMELNPLVGKEWLAHNQLEIGFYSVPVGAGGDFYHWWRPIPNNGYRDDHNLWFVIGDAVGHDDRASWLAQLTLKTFIEHGFATNNPRDLIQKVNESLLTRINNMSEFVTAMCGKFNPLTGELHFARAGHVFPLIYTKDGLSVELPFKNGHALNLTKTPDIHEDRVLVPKDGLLLLLTDGVTEARKLVNKQEEAINLGQSQAETLGIEGVHQIVRILLKRDLPIQQLCWSFMHMVLANPKIFPKQIMFPHDDLTLLALRRW